MNARRQAAESRHLAPGEYTGGRPAAGEYTGGRPAAGEYTGGRQAAGGSHRAARRRTVVRPGGFTLVELLVVITIIGILASLTLAALNSARHTARASKTKSTIAKLDVLVGQHYESYRTRRVTYYNVATGDRVNPTIFFQNPGLAAALRLHAIRDLMRMEMPERWYDITDDPVPFPVVALNFAIRRPSLSRSYLRRYNPSAPTPGGDYDSAECLYLWVTLSIPEVREQFGDSEIGDADGDGWLEFRDAWGNPIKFLRWAPGFLGSEIQENVLWDPSLTDEENRIVRQAVSSDDHDPFDPRVVDIDSDPTEPSWPPRGGWRLVPLIYSAGPDGIYGINHGGPYRYTGNPYFYISATGFDIVRIGEPVTGPNVAAKGPVTGNGLEDYLDNTHNHRLDVR